MREILFRGKRKNNGEWVYWNIYGEFCTSKGRRTRLTRKIPYGEKYYYYIYELKQLIDPETVGQFSGLTDKNGTKIFEGDIIYKPVEKITPYYATKSERYKIIFRNGSFSYANLRGGTYWSIDDSEVGIDTKSYTIIANIYDNPELLKEIDKE